VHPQLSDVLRRQDGFEHRGRTQSIRSDVQIQSGGFAHSLPDLTPLGAAPLRTRRVP
jgi:hypothetical protein